MWTTRFALHLDFCFMLVSLISVGWYSPPRKFEYSPTFLGKHTLALAVALGLEYAGVDSAGGGMDVRRFI